jgi:hypothetical protein
MECLRRLLKQLLFLFILMVVYSNSVNAQRILSSNFNIGVNYTSMPRYFEKYPVESIRNEIKNVRSAHTLSLEGIVFYKNRIGIGLGYEYFAKNSNTSIVDIGSITSPNYASYSHDVYFHSFSPSIYYKTPVVRNVYSIIAFGGLDYTKYRNPYMTNGLLYEVSGNNLGFQCGIKNEFNLSNHFNAGIGIKYRNNLVDKITFENGISKKEYELLGDQKINISSISIGFYLGIK